MALYGMGSMRDERLNRMWQGKKVRFLRPEQDMGGGRNNREDDDEEEESRDWFNIFTLHQNRDLGRGSKNCVHESMIPEWMDLVVWGHEHECNIEPAESLVGTFRVTQPGSSVATSLTAGEARRKQVGILDIRGQQFRLLPVPLSSVRAFAVGDVNLGEIARSHGGVLDVEDPKVEERMGDVLAGEVEALVSVSMVCGAPIIVCVVCEGLSNDELYLFRDRFKRHEMKQNNFGKMPRRQLRRVWRWKMNLILTNVRESIPSRIQSRYWSV